MAIRLIIALLAVLVIQSRFTALGNALENTPLPTDRDIYFKFDGLTFSNYLQLRPDGTYRQVTREHLYTEERDHGKWEQAASGDLLSNPTGITTISFLGFSGYPSGAERGWKRCLT